MALAMKLPRWWPGPGLILTEPVSHVNVKCVSKWLGCDLGEDAGGGGHSAVHHAVENGQQAVQRERLWPQKVVTCLER